MRNKKKIAEPKHTHYEEVEEERRNKKPNSQWN